MFMEGPAPGDAGGTPAPTPAAAEAPTGPSAADLSQGGASDAKGWTVFMDRSPVAGAPAAPGGPMQFARGSAQGPTAAGEAVGPSPGAEPDMARGGRTIVASGAVTGPAGGVTGRPGAPAGSQAPETTYFRRGATEPERIAGAGAEEVHVSSRAPAIEGQGPGTSPVPVAAPPHEIPAVSPGRSAPVAYDEPAGSGKTVIVVAGVVVVIAIVAAVILLL
jgi:hypothetical protein